MLILARKENETLVIDGDIRITICQIRGNQVKLAIDAPDEVEVMREELLYGSGGNHQESS